MITSFHRYAVALAALIDHCGGSHLRLPGADDGLLSRGNSAAQRQKRCHGYQSLHGSLPLVVEVRGEGRRYDLKPATIPLKRAPIQSTSPSPALGRGSGQRSDAARGGPAMRETGKPAPVLNEFQFARFASQPLIGVMLPAISPVLVSA